MPRNRTVPLAEDLESGAASAIGDEHSHIGLTTPFVKLHHVLVRTGLRDPVSQLYARTTRGRQGGRGRGQKQADSNRLHCVELTVETNRLHFFLLTLMCWTVCFFTIGIGSLHRSDDMVSAILYLSASAICCTLTGLLNCRCVGRVVGSRVFLAVICLLVIVNPLFDGGGVGEPSSFLAFLFPAMCVALSRPAVGFAAFVISCASPILSFVLLRHDVISLHDNGRLYEHMILTATLPLIVTSGFNSFIWYVYQLQAQEILIQTALDTEALTRQQLEEHAQRRVAEASKARDEFLSKISHEIRTPLNGILGMVELMNSTVTTKLQMQYLRVMTACGTILLDLINSVLDFSAMREGKLAVYSNECDIHAICSQVAAAVSFAASRSKLEVIFEVDMNTPILIGDERRLLQILVNLVANAVKFTQEGHVLVKLSYVEGHTVAKLTEWASQRIGSDSALPSSPSDRQSPSADDGHTHTAKTAMRQLGSLLSEREAKFPSPVNSNSLPGAVDDNESFDGSSHKASPWDQEFILHISVEDTGVGMTQDAADHVFDAFVQAHSVESRKYGGSGLGLAIVQSLVKMMGGHVRAKSEVGKGSKFVALLPLRSAQPRKSDTALTQIGQRGSLNQNDVSVDRTRGLSVLRSHRSSEPLPNAGAATEHVATSAAWENVSVLICTPYQPLSESLLHMCVFGLKATGRSIDGVQMMAAEMRQCLEELNSSFSNEPEAAVDTTPMASGTRTISNWSSGPRKPLRHVALIVDAAFFDYVKRTEVATEWRSIISGARDNGIHVHIIWLAHLSGDMSTSAASIEEPLSADSDDMGDDETEDVTEVAREYEKPDSGPEQVKTTILHAQRSRSDSPPGRSASRASLSVGGNVHTQLAKGPRDMKGFTYPFRYSKQTVLSKPVTIIDLLRAGRTFPTPIGMTDHVGTPMSPASTANGFRTSLAKTADQSSETKMFEASSNYCAQQEPSSLHVLIAEDNPFNQIVLSELLSSQGHTFVIAEDGQMAANVFQASVLATRRRSLSAGKHRAVNITHSGDSSHGKGSDTNISGSASTPDKPFDVIFMDCFMPGMDGFAATQLIRGIEKSMKLPRTLIVACTASANQTDFDHCMQSGMDHVLLKPLSLSMIKSVFISFASAISEMQRKRLDRHDPEVSAASSTRSRVQAFRPAAPMSDTVRASLDKPQPMRGPPQSHTAPHVEMDPLESPRLSPEVPNTQQ